MQPISDLNDAEKWFIGVNANEIAIDDKERAADGICDAFNSDA